MLSFACINSPMHLQSAILKRHTTKPAQNKFVTMDSSQTNNTDCNANSLNFIKTVEIGRIGILYILLAKAKKAEKLRTTYKTHHLCGLS